MKKKHICTPQPADLFNIKQYQCGCGKYFFEIKDSKMILRMLGKTIKLLRLYYGWSQQKFADEMYVSIQRVRYIEDGKSNLTLKTIDNIGGTFGLSGFSLFLITFEGLPYWRRMIETSVRTLQRSG